jgi:HTH-type transcriptional regulator/antitoxin HigA
MEITPIKTEADYEAALAEVESLMDAEPNTPRGDRLDVLVTLVEAYEAAHWAIEAPDPIEAVQLRMEQRGLTRADLQRILGSTSGRVSEILNRKRPLSVEMMRRLHAELDIPAESFLRPAKRPRSTATKRPAKKATTRSDKRGRSAA